MAASQKSAAMSKIAFLGAGLLGSGFVKGLRSKGHDVTVWNRTAGKTQELEALGARAAATPQEAIADADRVHLCLSADAAVEDVLAAILPSLPRTTPLLDHSTTSPALTAERGARLTELGQAFLDAPVFMSPVAAARGAGIMMCEVLPGPWPTITTQRVQLTQVWSNLLSNAMKHGVPKGGHIELGCGWQDGELCFWTRDDGPGIEPIYHQKIFDLFQRLVSRDQVEGAGIGLSIVRKLVDRNGGRIWVESAPGDGTTFKFTWSSHDPA